MILSTSRVLTASLLACTALLTGCKNPPGKPGPEPEVVRPEQVLDFPTLYAQNCAGCHGANGKNGAAISLANPIYLALAGTQNVTRATAEGVPNTAMPPFAQSKGGMLTDRQIAIITQGMEQAWGNASAFSGQTLPAYASAGPGNPENGQKAFATYCAQCHGADGTGGKSPKGQVIGSLVDPAYLALISDQGLRSIIIAGQPEQGMPDWRNRPSSSAARPINDQEITDVVAWLTSHRIATPGQPYQQHQ
jgi:mono/diheme cytochrome c family protein